MSRLGFLAFELKIIPVRIYKLLYLDDNEELKIEIIFRGYMKVILFLFFVFSCSELNSSMGSVDSKEEIVTPADFPALVAKFSGKIDFNNLPNYSSQAQPAYITKDNTTSNPINDREAILGRILFYDKNLSSDNSLSCSSCHQQEHAFSDLDDASIGVNGDTGRHSMRLVNTRFANEDHFFWDERANTLEEQTTEPIQDHNEMGFSGTLGDEDLDDLIDKLAALDYYQELFTFVYGSSVITEERLQNSMAQFIRSIQSFDSKYDLGRSLASNDNANFSNFTLDENEGKRIFLSPRNLGGAACAGCHQPPEFAIDPNSGNNGVIGSLDGSTDLTNTRAPSLRDLVKVDGSSNGKFMHDASLATLLDVIEHYDNGVVDNAELDNRLRGAGGNVQNLGLSTLEKSQIESFLKTLSGSSVYSDDKWSDPF